MAKKLEEWFGSRAAETLAKYYHILWAILCIYNAANFCYAAVLCYPIASSYGGAVGLVFKHNYWGSVAQVGFSLFGLLWHVYGAHRHAVAIERIDAEANIVPLNVVAVALKGHPPNCS